MNNADRIALMRKREQATRLESAARTKQEQTDAQNRAKVEAIRLIVPEVLNSLERQDYPGIVTVKVEETRFKLGNREYGHHYITRGAWEIGKTTLSVYDAEVERGIYLLSTGNIGTETKSGDCVISRTIDHPWLGSHLLDMIYEGLQKLHNGPDPQS